PLAPSSTRVFRHPRSRPGKSPDTPGSPSRPRRRRGACRSRAEASAPLRTRGRTALSLRLFDAELLVPSPTTTLKERGYIRCDGGVVPAKGEDPMGSAMQNSSLVDARLGLVALPMASIGRDQAGNQSAKSLGIAAKSIGAALVAVLIMVGLVSLPDLGKEAQAIPHCHLEVG